MKKSAFNVALLILIMGVCGADEDKVGVKTVSVMEGHSVTLHPETTIEGINKIQWKFRDELIAEVSVPGESIYPNERFKDRLNLNNQNGSLTINNTRITDSGGYKLEIDHNNGRFEQILNVTVHGSGLSPGAKAGIVVPLLVLVGAAGAFYYRHRICDLIRLLADISARPSETEESHTDFLASDVVTDEATASEPLNKTFEERILSVKEGDSVTLRTDAEIQTDDEIRWTFGPQDSPIAETMRAIATNDGPNRFRDRLKLDKTTGYLTISNITAEHSGVYKLQTSSSRGTSSQRFIVSVRPVMISVVEGESVTLHPDTEVRKDDLILWTFGYKDTVIAQMTVKSIKLFEGPDERVGDRHTVDRRTGSLTIESMRTEHAGLYKLQISSSRGTINETMKVAVNLKKISPMEGETVTLRTNTAVKRKDQVLWIFGDENTIIGEVKEGVAKICKFNIVNERFKDRLRLDEKTGSLIIRHLTTEHAGVYTLKLVTSKKSKIKRCQVVVRGLQIFGKEGKNVTLNPDAEIQRDDLILWWFGDNLIAQLTGETKEMTYADADERFRDKLQLDENTGSLTIRNITNGPYKLQIISSRRTFSRKIRVFVCCESGPKTVSGMTGECLILITDFNIESEESVQWSFEDKTLATGVHGDSNKTSYADQGFRGRLELHHRTGSLTIKNTRSSDTGVYRLKLRSRCGNNICWEFSVTVSDYTGNRGNKSAVVTTNEEVPVVVNGLQV